MKLQQTEPTLVNKSAACLQWTWTLPNCRCPVLAVRGGMDRLEKLGSQFSFLLYKHQTFPLLLLKGCCKIRLSAFVVLLAAAMPAMVRSTSQHLHFLAWGDDNGMKAGKGWGSREQGVLAPRRSSGPVGFPSPSDSSLFCGSLSVSNI